jgi:hypothetical protein
MALLHRAQLVPSKLELLAEWLPAQPWFVGSRGDTLETVASFRFDDPHGQVGVETLLVRANGGPVMQVPLTYRNEKREGVQDGFLGTLEHSVLGTRWVYDGLTDPVYRGELARVILAGDTQVELWIEIDGVMTQREPSARVKGSGGETDPQVDSVDLDVVRVPASTEGGPRVLVGTWTGSPDAVVLARATKR